MISKNKILSLDFAALQTLHFVYELGSFSQAAEKLGQTQSNVSYTVARLRECFDDPLFVRERRHMVPTERCRAVVAEAKKLLETFQGLATVNQFEPSTAADSVTLSCNHYERMTILPGLLRRVRKEAPGITLRVVNSHALGEEQLKRGECDLLLSPVQFSGERIFKRNIRNDRYCCIMDPQNPLAGKKLTLGDIGKSNLITLNFPGNWRPLYFSHLEAAGVKISSTVELSEYGDIGGYVSGTDLVAIVPYQIAVRLNTEIVHNALPVDVPIKIDMFWTLRTHHSPMQKWMRSLIAAEAASAT